MQMKRILFITGTDTGIGKTFLTVRLVKQLRASGINVAGLKPICSGGRGDAKQAHDAMDGALSLDEINPWHFKAAIAPLLAARQERKKVKLSQVASHVRAMQKRFDILVVEGAGGLLSPLGENFDSRDLIATLRAVPIIVAPNRLVVVNHILLTLEALPTNLRAKAFVVLVPQRKPDTAAKTNVRLLAQFFNPKRILTANDPKLVSKIASAT
jgi:dethiobiotin synthetase